MSTLPFLMLFLLAAAPTSKLLISSSTSPFVAVEGFSTNEPRSFRRKHDATASALMSSSMIVAAGRRIPQRGTIPISSEITDQNDDSLPLSIQKRRDAVLSLLALVPLSMVVATPSAQAAIQKSDKVLKPDGAALTEEEAIERLKAGRKSVRYLLDHYEEICEGGGDNVRRYLGTVGTTSGLFGISKAMKTLSDSADDIVEYTELANEVEVCIQQADGSSYMAIFVTTSTSQDRPEKYFGEALVEIKRLAKSLDELAELAGVKLDG